MVLGDRLEPPKGVELKLGDLVTYEVIFDDGSKGTISTTVTEFDCGWCNKGKVGKVE